MTLTDLTVAPDGVTLHWSGDAPSFLPAIWLRDNCPSGFHPQTGERLFDLLSVPDTPVISDGSVRGDAVDLKWDDGHESRFDVAWLATHRPGGKAADAADVPPLLWPRGFSETALPRHDAAALLSDDAALRDWLYDTARFGLSIVTAVPPRIDAGEAIARRVGFLRETNFGMTFDVVSKPDPNNLAYTAHALPLHTDLPNQEFPPGYQFLHCLANQAQGGGSVFADGFAIAEHLRRTDPEAFSLLSQIEIPFRFHDDGADIRKHSPVIQCDGAAAVREIRFNAHIAGVFDMPSDLMARYYRAYRAFMRCTRDPDFRVTLRLQEGEMVVFDNRRALHGREAFDPSTGFRHLHGCYVDRGEFMSRLRVLSRA